MSFPAWIPVTDRLPDSDDDVLAVADGIAPTVGWFSVRFKKWLVQNGDGPVTHWMPLPDPPDAGKAADTTGGKP